MKFGWIWMKLWIIILKLPRHLRRPQTADFLRLSNWRKPALPELKLYDSARRQCQAGLPVLRTREFFVVSVRRARLRLRLLFCFSHDPASFLVLLYQADDSFKDSTYLHAFPGSRFGWDSLSLTGANERPRASSLEPRARRRPLRALVL